MKKIIVYSILILCTFACTKKPVLPEGYRIPTKEELSLPSRESNPDKFITILADFNGDSFIDRAMLLVNEDKKELALFTFISVENQNNYEWYKIESLPYNAIIYTGIDKILPGNIKYYPDAKDKKKEEISLINESIRLFNFEGSSSVIYYETKTGRFKQVWTSK